MTENRRYYYLKLKEYFFNSETIMILESMQDGLLYSNLLLKMYLMSLKSGGIILLADHFPHTPQTIATCTRHQIGTVERGLKIFLQLGLIEILTDGAYYMTDIQLLIGQSSTEGERKKRERTRLKRQKLLPSGELDICPPTPVDKCPPILEIDKDIDTELDIDREIEGGEIAPAVLGRYQNVFLSDREQAELQAEFPNLWREYIERLSEYMASTGKRYRNHAATIRRWIADDRRKAAPPARDRDYSVEDGDTV
ncbi:MAG: phage replisome organizer N-terminal domain-containing protein [Oscillospiraceae bacterium]|nr:phage replisome organizer N-terminal domain-containing protein [Oscillospiraceae bacterium]